MKSQLKTPQCLGLPCLAARTGCCTLFHPIRHQHRNGIETEKWFSPLRELWSPFSESFSWTCPQFAFNFVFRRGKQIVVLLWEKEVSWCVCLSCLTSRRMWTLRLNSLVPVGLSAEAVPHRFPVITLMPLLPSGSVIKNLPAVQETQEM